MVQATLLTVTGDTGRGRASCKHKTYKGEPYFLASKDADIYSLCLVCGKGLARVRKVDAVIDAREVSELTVVKGLMVVR